MPPTPIKAEISNEPSREPGLNAIQVTGIIGAKPDLRGFSGGAGRSIFAVSTETVALVCVGLEVIFSVVYVVLGVSGIKLLRDLRDRMSKS